MIPTNKRVVIVMGPPGSGKGTQANLIADKLNLFHLDTGRFLETLVHDPSLQNDPEVSEERDKFDKGILLDPFFFLKWVTEKIKSLHNNGSGIIFSGSPRTMLETCGDESHKGLMDVLSDLYGKDNIQVFLLEASGDTSISRNSSRMICSICGNAILGVLKLDLKQCPICGGSFRKRVLDDPEIIKVRLEEYKNRTGPVINELTKRGFEINRIDATPMPFEVFEKITSLIK